MKNFLFLGLPLLLLSACSTGNYKVEVSCAEDPHAYNQEREELYRKIEQEEKAEELRKLEQECKRPAEE